MKQLSLVLSLISVAFSQSANDVGSLSVAQKGIAANLMSYYNSSSLGSIPEKTSEGPDGFQWFEMGFYCNKVLLI